MAEIPLRRLRGLLRPLRFFLNAKGAEEFAEVAKVHAHATELDQTSGFVIRVSGFTL